MPIDRRSVWATWVNDQLERKGWIPADLVRASGLKSNGRPVIDASRVKAWLAGEPPRDPALITAAATAFEVRRTDVLLASGWLDEGDIPAGGNAVPTDILTAIEDDIELLDEAREHLRNQYQLLRRLGPELSDRSRTTTPRRAQPPRPARRLRPVAHEGDPAHADVIDEMAREVRRQYEEGKPDR